MEKLKKKDFLLNKPIEVHQHARAGCSDDLISLVDGHFGMERNPDPFPKKFDQ